MSIHFGTDGWRAVIADEFTFENLQMVAQSVADYINQELRDSSHTPEVVIGYDTRFLSDRFAADVARVMAGNSIMAWLTRTDTPTPAVSYHVKAKNAVAGIMITASHNAPRYNGFKLKANYGGSATPAACARVEYYLERIIQEQRKPILMDLHEGLEKDHIRKFDASWSYYEHLSRLLDLDSISNAELNIIADPMFGSGRGAIREILGRTRSHVHEIRGYMNPGFEGIHPEPIRKHLDKLAATIQQQHADVGLATDGDADRIGAMDNHGNFVDPHHIMALGLLHLVEKRGLRGDVVKTVSTTAMLNRIANQYGLKVHETPVGFNHIADHIMNGDVLIGGEESGGISIRGHVPEGDGILMGLLLLEVMASYGRKTPLNEIIINLQKQYGPTFYKREDIYLKTPVVKKEMVKRLQDAAPNTLAGQRVKDVQTLDGVKFILEDESWLLVRPSGTEPVLRVYAEATSQEAIDEMLLQGQAMAES